MAGKRRAIFISGCDSGFGYSLALHCQRHMDLEVIAGCYQPSSDQSGAKTLAQEGVEIVALDVTKDDSIADALIKTQTILEEKDLELWSVVNNAAVLVFAEAEWQTRDMVRHQFDVNVVGALELTKAFLPLLRRSQGRVVNMVSFCTDCPLPTLSVYTATKAALKSLSNGMRMELSKFKVDVILFNPGDHPGETPLCSNQDIHYQIMDSHVSTIADYDSFAQYYSDCRAKFAGLFRSLPFQKLDNPGLYQTFEQILTTPSPRAEYTNSDMGTRGFFWTLGVLPTFVSDYLRKALMKLPKLVK